MASWMIHLRVADHLLDQISNLSPKEFVVGNIAPDSGLPNADWSRFTPDATLSHFKLDNRVPKTIHIPLFVEHHFTPAQQCRYSREELSFFLGYLSHLLTDQLWSERVVCPLQHRFPLEWAENKNDLIWRAKADWYDLDFLYLQQHPSFRAFSIYEQAVDFQNTFMDIFPPDAFENRRQYITGFYRQKKEHLDREYPFLTPREASVFVQDACQSILSQLPSYISEDSKAHIMP